MYHSYQFSLSLSHCSEVLCVIDSLQLTASEKVATPANWTMSDPPPLSALKARYQLELNAEMGNFKASYFYLAEGWMSHHGI